MTLVFHFPCAGNPAATHQETVLTVAVTTTTERLPLLRNTLAVVAALPHPATQPTRSGSCNRHDTELSNCTACTVKEDLARYGGSVLMINKHYSGDADRIF